jgi:hypothetical protein
VDFSRDPREPCSCPLIGQEAEIESFFGSADEFAARAPVSSSSEYLLYADQPLRIPGLSKATFLVPAPHALRDHSECSFFVDRLPNRDGGLVDTPLVVPTVATLTDDFKIRITIVNLSEKTTTIPHLQAVASLYVRFKIHDGYDGYTDGLSSSFEGKLTEEKLKLLDSAQIDPDDRLTPAQRNQVRELLAKGIDAIAVDPKMPNRTHLIEVGSCRLISAPFLIDTFLLGSVSREKIVDAEVDAMERSGTIRKSNSAWASRVVLVTKKYGSVRFCIDYRALNSRLQLEDSPLPLTAEAIDRLSSGQGSRDSLFLCVLDLAFGFRGLPVREGDKGKTAFVTHRGKYEFNYLPCGVQSGPSYMCRVMDAVLKGLAWDICMPYLDESAFSPLAMVTTSKRGRRLLFNRCFIVSISFLNALFGPD